MNGGASDAERPDPSRLGTADVILIAQDGFSLAPARVRCYGFARALRRRGLRAEVLSFFDHLGASRQGAAAWSMPEAEKFRLNLQAFELLSSNPQAVLYVQKAGYHGLSVLMAAACNGNRFVLDYDDYEVEGRPFGRLTDSLPALAGEPLLRSLALRAEACVASSHAIRDLLSTHNANTCLIHTVADADLFHPDGRSRPRRRFGDRVNLLWCGDVWGDIPMKDILFAVDAFALMPRALREKARFHVIGFGCAWEELKRRIRLRHPGLDAVVLHESIPPQAFGDVLAEMDVGLLPYDDNAFNRAKSPTKMFEFLLAKVAVCATPVGEATHCLEDGVSALFAQGVRAYSAAMARLVDDDALRARIAETAHRVGVASFTLEGVGDRLAEVVRAAAAPRRSEASTQELGAFLARALGRRLPVAPREILLSRRDAQAVLAAGDPAAVDPRRWSAPLFALLDWPGLASADGFDAAAVRETARAGRTRRHAAQVRAEILLPPAARPAGPPSLCKLAAAEDWEDEGWWRWAIRFKRDRADDPGDADDADTRDHLYSFYKRSAGAWERIHALYALDRLGLLDGTRRFLVVGAHVDGFYLFLSNLAQRVDVLDVGEDASAHARRVADGEMDPWLLKPRVYDHARLSIHHGASPPESVGEPVWDAVVLLRGTLLRDGIPEILAWADERLRKDGALVVQAEARLNDGGDVAGMHPVMLEDGRLAAALARWSGIELEGGFDASLSDATADRLVVAGAPDAANPYFIVRAGATLHMPAVWIGRRRTPTPESGWRALVRALRGGFSQMADGA